MPVGEIDGTEVSGKPVIVCDEDVRAGDVLAAMLYNKKVFFFCLCLLIAEASCDNATLAMVVEKNFS
jgi:hypothetical protein